jgi:hypothetical protein
MKMAIIALLVLFACGKKDKKEKTVVGPQGPSCKVSQLTDSAKITCPDGSVATVQNGAAGANGASCSVEQLTNGSKISCTDGTYALILNGIDGAPGRDGIDGSNGSQGYPGQDGLGCSVVGSPTGARVMCGDGTSVDINNGLSGQDCTLQDLVNGVRITCGLDSAVVLDGTSTYSVAQIIDPCGPTLGEFDEVILKLQNGSLMAHYSHGNDQFLTLLEPDRHYVTTDDQSCYFYVDVNNNVSW